MTVFKRFRITKAATSPVRISVNGKPASFPLGLEHGLDDQPGLTRQEILGALDGSNVEYELVGEAPAPAVDALAEAGGAGGITAPSAESAPGAVIDPNGPISGPSAGSSKGEDVEGGGPSGAALVGRGEDGPNEDSPDKDSAPLSDSERDELLKSLDQSVPKVEASLEGRSAAELSILYAAEKAAMDRKGVIAAIEARFEDSGKGEDA